MHDKWAQGFMWAGSHQILKKVEGTTGLFIIVSDGVNTFVVFYKTIAAIISIIKELNIYQSIYILVLM